MGWRAGWIREAASTPRSCLAPRSLRGHAAGFQHQSRADWRAGAPQEVILKRLVASNMGCHFSGKLIPVVYRLALIGNVEALDYGAAHRLSLGLLLFAFVVLLAVYALGRRPKLCSIAATRFSILRSNRSAGRFSANE